jgi:DNA-directed RNA polymerase specialized sigma24 family protein
VLPVEAGHDDRSLLIAARTGDERVGMRVVERHQRDLLRVVYLLCGDGERAAELAAAALLDAFRRPPDEEADLRQHLLIEVARRSMERPGRSTWLRRDSESNYAVDDERDRVRAALDRLEPAERAMLVLNRYAGLPEQASLPLLNANIYEQRAMTARAASRVAIAAGRSSDGPVADLLARLLVDAPASDLWPEVSGSLRMIWATRRRRRRLLLATALSPLLIVLVAGLLWLAGRDAGDGESASGALLTPPSPTATPSAEAEPRAQFAAAATPSPAPREAVSVPDLQLIRAIEQGGTGRSSLHAYDPATNDTRLLLNAGGLVNISPDGRWLVSRSTLSESPGTTVLAAMPLDGGGKSWEVTLPSVRSLAIDARTIYALVPSTSNEARFRVEVVELASGTIRGGWEAATPDEQPDTVWGTQLYAPLDGERLYLLTEHFDDSGQTWIGVMNVYRPEDGELIDSFVHELPGSGGQIARGFSPSGALPTPGGGALYSVVPDENWSKLRVQFLDLESGRLSTMPLPLTARSTSVSDSRGDAEIHLVPSNTGELLYVIQSRFRQVAVVDLLGRSMIGIFPLSSGAFDRSSFESNLNRVSYLETLLSPDGRLLYLASSWERNQAVFGYPARSPVWIIDTTSWEVVARMMVDGLPRSMTLSGDGSQLVVRSERTDGEILFTVLDTAGGEVLHVRQEIPVPEWADLQRLSAVQHIFQAQYGYRPVVDGVIPQDNRIVSILPAVRIEAGDAMAGADTLVTARVVHPVSGAPAIDDHTLRFDPEAALVIELTRDDRQVILIPSKIEPGVYQGLARLDLAGTWNAHVTIINRDGTTWSAALPAAVKVAEGLLATDGNEYGFEIRPANPVSRRTITLRVWMINAETGRRLPGEVEIADGVPGRVQLVLTHSEGERIEVPLDPLDHASFLGWARFSLPGEWTAEVSFEREDGRRVTVEAGVIEIHDLTEPYQRAGPPSGGARMGNPHSQ